MGGGGGGWMCHSYEIYLGTQKRLFKKTLETCLFFLRVGKLSG